MYLILHAFSRRNAGDGLLVDLTLEALRDAGISTADCHVLALDPSSFPDLDHVHPAPGEPSARFTFKLCRAGWEVLADRLGAGEVSRLTGRARGLIGVGGGYLVTETPIRQMGVLFNHLVQLRRAALSAAPTIYMPQSIGPLPGPVGRISRHYLAQIDRLYVRDDRSFAEVVGPNARRCGDLAVMKLSRVLKEISYERPGDGHSLIVARDLSHAPGYVDRLRRLEAAIPSPCWAVQADTEGPRSDRAFYARHGIADGGTLSAMLESGTPSVVVSVRLHGAIAALLAGRPAVHLAYDRKGWGAYEDLGISDYVHDARRFDVEKVAEQVSALCRNSAAFWAKVQAAAPALRAQYAELVADLRQRLPR